MSIQDIKSIGLDKNFDVKVIDQENQEYYLMSRNFYGEHEKIKAPNTNKKVTEFLSIEHNPSVAIVVHSKNFMREIEELKNFADHFIKSRGLNESQQPNSVIISTTSFKRRGH